MLRRVAATVDRSTKGGAREELAGIVLLAFILIAVPVALASLSKTFHDGDVSWHIASGRWILEHRAIPRGDPFSFTAAGHPWIAMEWLADVLYAGAFRVFGYAGVAAIVAAALLTLHAILVANARRSVGPLGIAASVAAMDAVIDPFMQARPHLLVWPIMAAWTAILLRSVERRKTPPWPSVLLLIVWTNIHASFPLALVIGGAIALDGVIAAEWRNWREWGAFLALSAAALLLNANGMAGVLQPFHIMNMQTLPFITEWKPSTPSLAPQFYAVLLLGIGGLLWRGIKLPIGQLLLLLLLLGLAFYQLRHEEWFVIVAALIIPAHCRSEAWPRPAAKPFLLLGLAAVAVRAIIPLTPSEHEAYPSGLLAAVPPELRDKPVFNGYVFGGPLILAGIRPYIDGRAEMYGDAFFSDYLKMTDGDVAAFDVAVQRYGIRWTMLPWSATHLIRPMERSGKWRRIYSDDVGVIDVRVQQAAI